MSAELAARTCVACHGGMPALTSDEVAALLAQRPALETGGEPEGDEWQWPERG
jgi:hypothetical protein